MDLSYPPEVEAFRDEIRKWLIDELPDGWFDGRRPTGDAYRAFGVEWNKMLQRTGWSCPTWPTEYGGLGLDSDRAAVVNNTLRRFKVPRTDNPLGINVSQALLRWGTDAQRQRFLPGIAHQREIWVQLFSEPGAGSDRIFAAGNSSRDR